MRKISIMSLKSKLVLSYLLVILGTVLVLSLAVSLAVQNYIKNQQIESLRQSAAYLAREAEGRYQYNGGWNTVAFSSVAPSQPMLLILVDAKDNPLLCSQPDDFDGSNCSNPQVKHELVNSLQDQSTSSGDIQISTRDGNFSFIYISVPLKAGDQTIGALFLTQPQFSPRGGLLPQINRSILLAGLIVAAIAALCSYLLVRRFMRPVESLTLAAERMKYGNYTQRVPSPNSQDELGQLALTFNEMASTIEADVTELRRQDEVRRDLIANIAHDLATPLTAIQGLSEALADDVISDPTARQETAQLIGREVQRLRRMVADVRQMTSLEAGQTPLDLAPLDLQSLVDETLLVLKPECEQMGITLYNDVPDDIPQVQVDSDRVIQVLLNLLDNARRHTPDGGSIRVGARAQDSHIEVWVSDTGSGIDPADLPHIFERFYRADRSRTTTTGGSGLGLSIVKAIITAHSGTVSAESTLSQGTRIMFTLPVAGKITPTLVQGTAPLLA
ncbi:MAG: HAMP domain-containing histidine kinase [Ktedonobacteraceae bacterium]|nr:HAMP domain-containing histidine kinase [Ktedonobacteraceae bacterium]